MIWVLDNGMGYSAHELVFVETPDDFEMPEYLDAANHTAGGQRWYWVGKAPSISWRRPGAAMTLEEFDSRLGVDGVRWQDFR